MALTSEPSSTEVTAPWLERYIDHAPLPMSGSKISSDPGEANGPVSLRHGTLTHSRRPAQETNTRSKAVIVSSAGAIASLMYTGCSPE